MQEKSYWSQFSKPNCYPNNCNCEALSDSWVQQPSATLSSLPLIILGFWILFSSLKIDKKLVVMGGAVIFLGLASTAAHGTFTAFALHLDFLAILLCLSWLVVYCSGLRWGMNWVLTWMSFTGLTFFLTLFFEKYRILFCILYFCIVFCIWLIWYKKNKIVKKYFFISYIVLSFSALVFYLDENKIWCPDPYGWFLGHSLWHLGVCFSLGYSFIGLKKLHMIKR